MSMDHQIAASALPRRTELKLEAMGITISRYGLSAALLLIGLLKFTAAEAAGIQPLIAASPLISWMYLVLSVRAASNLIGSIEIVLAVLIALRPLSPAASFAGSLGSGDAGQFLIKHVVLLGAALWTASEAFMAGHV